MKYPECSTGNTPDRLELIQSWGEMNQIAGRQAAKDVVDLQGYFLI